MIYNVPDPPAGSKIAVVRDAYELKLSWGGRRTVARLVLSVVGSVIMALMGSALQFLNLSRSQTWALTFVAGSVFLAFLGSFIHDYRALRPETLLLGLDGLTHTAGGKNSSAAPVLAAPWSFRLWNPRSRRRVPRADVGELGPGARDGKAFVTMEVADGDTREMGWGLADADREWLVEVLKRWKDSPG
ncbi:MAG: hypothetical protein ACYTKD_30205 [Planctomycetota bacterium]